MFGDATAALGPAVGIRGNTASPEGAGVIGCAAGSGACFPAVGGAGVVGYAPPGVPGPGSASGVSGWADSPNGAGVIGTGLKFGVRGKAYGPVPGGGVGVYGTAVDVPDGSPSYGVHGYAQGDIQDSAGVLAEGNGTSGPAGPDAAALEIRNGAIRVSGDNRPAGRVQLGASWSSFGDCAGDTIGYMQDIVVLNDLIVEGTPPLGDGSIILATVEIEGAGDVSRSYIVQVFEKHNGTMKFRVSAIGRQSGPPCSAPAGIINRYVSYLIINPLPIGS